MELVKKRLAKLIISKSQNNERINQLDSQAKILKQRLCIETDSKTVYK